MSIAMAKPFVTLLELKFDAADKRVQCLCFAIQRLHHPVSCGNRKIEHMCIALLDKELRTRPDLQHPAGACGR